MSALVIVDGLLEGLQLLSSLAQSMGQVSAAIHTAQATGKPVDYTGILGQVNIAEAAVLASISAAKAAGK